MEETKICPYCGEEILAVAKKCKHCGEWLEENEPEKSKEQVSCPVCGEMIDEDVVECPFCHEKVVQNAPTYEEVEEQKEVREGLFSYYFLDAIKNHYADFSRCATRKEFWMYVLFNYLVQFVLMCLAFINFTFAIVVSSIYSLAILIPSLAMAVARLRDINKKWTNLFFSLIPIVGPIILLVFMCREGEKKNRKGTKMVALDYVIIVLAIVGFIAFNIAQAKLINQLFSNEMGTMDIYSTLLGSEKGGSKIKMPDIQGFAMIGTQGVADIRIGPGEKYPPYFKQTFGYEDVVCYSENKNGWSHLYFTNGDTAWIRASDLTSNVFSAPTYNNIHKLQGAYDGYAMGVLNIIRENRSEYKYIICTGKELWNGIIFPYYVWVKVTETSGNSQVMATDVGEIEVLYGNDWRVNDEPFSIDTINYFSEKEIDLILKQSSYMDYLWIAYEFKEDV